MKMFWEGEKEKEALCVEIEPPFIGYDYSECDACEFDIEGLAVVSIERKIQYQQPEETLIKYKSEGYHYIVQAFNCSMLKHMSFCERFKAKLGLGSDGKVKKASKRKVKK